MGSVWNLQLEDVMSGNVVTLDETDSVQFAMKMLSRSGISGAPVVNGAGDYVGVVSRSDLLGRKVIDWVANKNDLQNLMVTDIMTPGKPVTVELSASVIDVVRMMKLKKFHRVFVHDADGEMVGVVTTFDMLTVLDMLVSEGVSVAPESSPATQRVKQAAAKPEAPENEIAKKKLQQYGQTEELDDELERLIVRKQKELFG